MNERLRSAVRRWWRTRTGTRTREEQGDSSFSTCHNIPWIWRGMDASGGVQFCPVLSCPATPIAGKMTRSGRRKPRPRLMFTSIAIAGPYCTVHSRASTVQPASAVGYWQWQWQWQWRGDGQLDLVSASLSISTHRPLGRYTHTHIQQ